MKVYVLTSGEYSDYHIVGVLLDEEQARIAAEVMTTRYDDVTVEEYDTDVLKFIKPGWKYWAVDFSEKTHSVVDVSYHDYFDALREPRFYERNKIWTVEVYAEDEDHAIKSASDKLDKYLAEQAGL